MNEIIVSLTSYPARLDSAFFVVKSMLNQTVRPNKVILYLFKGQFDIDKVEKYKRNEFENNSIFEIHWVEDNLMAHKKYYYAFQEYPNDLIITVDDDFEYPLTLIEELFANYEKYPRTVIARRVHKIVFEDDQNISEYKYWLHEYTKEIGDVRFDLFATNGGGTLFPPHIFGTELFNKKIIMDNVLYADDIWLKIMELYYEIPTVCVVDEYKDKVIHKYADDGLFRRINRYKNDIQLKTLLDIYRFSNMNNSLIQIMHRNNYIYRRDVTEKMNKLLVDFFSSIADDFIYVYGAGCVAKRICKYFDNRKVCIKAFLVENTDGNEDIINGIPVICWKDSIDDRRQIVIGLSYDKQQEALVNLEKGGISKSVCLPLTKEILEALIYIE